MTPTPGISLSAGRWWTFGCTNRWNVKDVRTIPTIIQNMNDIQSDMVARLRASAADGTEYKGAWLKSIEQLTGPALGVDEDTDYRYLESSWRATICEYIPDP